MEKFTSSLLRAERNWVNLSVWRIVSIYKCKSQLLSVLYNLCIFLPLDYACVYVCVCVCMCVSLCIRMVSVMPVCTHTNMHISVTVCDSFVISPHGAKEQMESVDELNDLIQSSHQINFLAHTHTHIHKTLCHKSIYRKFYTV